MLEVNRIEFIARIAMHPQSLQDLRPRPGRVPQVRHLPHLLPRQGFRRVDPRRAQGKLVEERSAFSDQLSADQVNCRPGENVFIRGCLANC